MDLSSKEVLTFDCYGTLIDWERGILEAVRPVLRNHGRDPGDERTLELFATLESAIEADTYRPYTQVLAEVMHGFGRELGFTPTSEDVTTLAESVGNWPAFADSPGALAALKRKYRLAIISNIDDELFALSNRRLGIAFDWIITAQQARTYKPSLNNFRLAFERIGRPVERLLHVAQSLFHDHLPARSLGLDAVWVNRRHDRPGSGATPVASVAPQLEVPDLQTLADLLLNV
jgi:2-haloacid dehalogenase